MLSVYTLEEDQQSCRDRHDKDEEIRTSGGTLNGREKYTLSEEKKTLHIQRNLNFSSSSASVTATNEKRERELDNKWMFTQ